MAPLPAAGRATPLSLQLHLPDRRLLELMRKSDSTRSPSNADDTVPSIISRSENSAPLPLLETRDPSPTIALENGLPTRVEPRQNIVATSTIPSGYGALDAGPDPGTVVGITLGAVGGFVLLLWFIYFCINLGNPDTVSIGTASVVTRKSRTHRRHHRHRSRGRATVEIRETTTSRPIVVEEPAPRVERVVMEERRREVSRPPPRVVPPEDDEDEVVVIEEHSPAPRRHRSSQRRSSDHRRDPGVFREVDPDRFAGGESPYREVRRSSGSRRR